MTQDIERYLTLAQGVSAHAGAGTLDPDTAVRFCRVILPALLVELDLARRVDARLSEMFPAPAVQQEAAEVTSPAVQKTSKKAAKKARKKKGAKK